jgi:hypothetical protein
MKRRGGSVATAHQRVSTALDLLTQGLGPYVERELESVYHNGWIDAARSSFRDIQEGTGDEPIHWDAHALLTVIWDQWNRVFKHRLGQFERSLVSELRAFRNRWAHQQDFDFDDTYRVLDSVQRVLSAVAADEAPAAGREKTELLREEFGKQAQEKKQSGFSWARDLGWLAIYLICCGAVVFHMSYFWGTSSWFLSVLVIFLFAYLIYQRLAAPEQSFGPHECDTCGKIIYGDACPYCDVHWLNPTTAG